MHKLIRRVAIHKSSKYFTPIAERFVYGLVYPAVLGACLVELMLNVKNYIAAAPWFLVLCIFVIDYSVVATETMDAPPRGNIFTALADFIGATGFFFAYVVWRHWDGLSAFSAKQLAWLVCVVYVHQVDYIVWYIFRWITRDLAGVRDDLFPNYKKMLKYNFWIAGVQAALVFLLGMIVILDGANQAIFCVMMAFCYIGVVLRVAIDYAWGPVQHREY